MLNNILEFVYQVSKSLWHKLGFIWSKWEKYLDLIFAFEPTLLETIAPLKYILITKS
jgi:hypothetical protein